MESKKYIWTIFHDYDVDNGYGDAIPKEVVIAICEATEEEICEFLEKWDKPEIYDHPYDDLYCHSIRAEKTELMELKDIQPYRVDDYFNTRIRMYKLRMKYNEKYGDKFYFNNKQARDEYLAELLAMEGE